MSNFRFTTKTVNSALTLAVRNYFENGGVITVCKPGRRSPASVSFPATRGSVAALGAKKASLRNSGLKG